MENTSQVPNRVWKEKPAGPEQLALEEMFHSGNITVYATPESVQQSNKLFHGFPSRIFNAHFRKTKAKLGEYRTILHSFCDLSVVENHFFVTVSVAKGFPGGIVPNNPDSGKIPELGRQVSPPIATRTPPETSEHVEIVNPPYTSWTYTDHNNKTDYVCVAINIFSGSEEITFNINDDGLSITAQFTWPNALIDPAIMFEEKLKSNATSMHHPMIHAMTTKLLQTGITEGKLPRGEWKIPLPIKVRREVTSYSMSKIVRGSAKILFLRFTAYQNDVIIENANRTMRFD